MTSPYKGRRRASYIIEQIGQNNDAIQEQNVILMKELLDLKKREARLKIIFDSIAHREMCRLNKPQFSPLSPPLSSHRLEERTKNASIDTAQSQEFIGDLTSDSTPRGSVRVQPLAGSKARNKVYKWPTTNYVHSHGTDGQRSATAERFVDKPTQCNSTFVSSGQGHRNEHVKKEGDFKIEREMSIVEEISLVSGSDFNSMAEYLLHRRGSSYPEKTKSAGEDLNVSDKLKEVEMFPHRIASLAKATPLHYDSIIDLDNPFPMKEHTTDTSCISPRHRSGRIHGDKMRSFSVSGQVGQGNQLIKVAKRRHTQPYGGQDLSSEFTPSSSLSPSSKLEGFRYRCLNQNDSKEDNELFQANKALDASLHLRETIHNEATNESSRLKARKVAEFSVEQDACWEDVIQVIKMEESTSQHVGDRREKGTTHRRVEPRRTVTTLSPSGHNTGYFFDVSIPHGQDERSKVKGIDQIKTELMETSPVFCKNKKLKMIYPSSGEDIESSVSDSRIDRVFNSSVNRAGIQVERFDHKKPKLVDSYHEQIDKIKNKLVESCVKFEPTDISLTRDLLEPVVKLRTPPTKAGVNLPTTPHASTPPADNYQFIHDTIDRFDFKVVEDAQVQVHVISDPHSVELSSIQDDVILNDPLAYKTMSLHHKTLSDIEVKPVRGPYQSGNSVPQCPRSTPKLQTPAGDFTLESFLRYHKVEEHGQLLARYENLTLLDRGTVSCVKPE